MFHPLDRKQIRKIVDVQVEKLRKLLDKQGVELTLTEEALDGIADLGYEPEFGARPLKRVLQRRLMNPLALELLKRPAKVDEFAQEKKRKINVGYDGEDFLFDFD